MKWNPDDYAEHVYEFKGTGLTKEGNRAIFTGEITGPKGYPSSVFEAARNSILKISPEFRFKGSGPTLKILRGKTKALSEKKNQNEDSSHSKTAVSADG